MDSIDNLKEQLKKLENPNYVTNMRLEVVYMLKLIIEKFKELEREGL